ncbi:ribbon-helix-helix protein, CopG family [Streptomyces sp. NPDC088197]|uniref:ribbon-helix-helix protein, CopG family n=1 Tax=unclassified Streptomyces TaxID=2593676 RepID=UPI00339E7C09
MASRVLSLRIDADLWDRIRDHAAKRGMSAQDYVVQALIRDDFDERFKTAVDETERFYGQDGPLSGPAPTPQAPAQSRPSAGIR